MKTYATITAELNTKVEFLVSAPAGMDLYICGNTTSLGDWDAAKAVKLAFCDECKKYTASKLLPAGEQIEFKVLSAKNWDAVEKGAHHEDVANHSFTAAKGAKVEVKVQF